MEEVIRQIVRLKEIIDADPTNDFYLYPFMALVLKLTDDKGFISDNGMKLLHNNVAEDILILKQGGDKPSQHALTRMALWSCLVYNLIIFFCGFVEGFEEVGNVYTNKIPIELMDYLKLISVRGKSQLETLDSAIKQYTSRMKDKFAQEFDKEKRRCWTKDLFNNSVHIPAHIDDVPEGFDRFGSNSKEVK